LKSVRELHIRKQSLGNDVIVLGKTNVDKLTQEVKQLVPKLVTLEAIDINDNN
jgi:short-subunit dehydrogenase involved in D-alanine esterification of teichoic acids